MKLLSRGAAPVAPQLRFEALRQGLRDLGWVEGQNIAFEYRVANTTELLLDMAAELVRLKVDVIVAPNNTVALAAQRASNTTPIVLVLGTEPVEAGLIISHARPGGNVTGLSAQFEDVAPKCLELLKAAIPRVTRVAVLSIATTRAHITMRRAMQAGAPALSVTLLPVEMRDPDDMDFESAFAAMSRERVGALIALPAGSFLWHAITDLASKSRLPPMYTAREFLDAGGHMSYGASFSDLQRRAATYVDKILKGAKPADLPVEQPTKFEFVINLKTAKALGLTVPQSILVRADQVIE